MKTVAKQQPSHTKALEDLRVIKTIKKLGIATSKQLHVELGGYRRSIHQRLQRLLKENKIQGKKTGHIWQYQPILQPEENKS